MNLLINEPPLQVLPSLAIQIGLNEAIVLQQLHYLLPMAQTIHDGKKWVYNSIKSWNEKYFPFFSKNTLIRTFDNLEKMGLILSEKLKKTENNQTKFYTINYDELSIICSKNNNSSSGNCSKSVQKSYPKQDNAIDQNEQIQLPKMGKCTITQNGEMLQENTNRIHTRENQAGNVSKKSSVATDEKTINFTKGDLNKKSPMATDEILGETLNLEQLKNIIALKLGTKAQHAITHPDFKFWLCGFNTHFEHQNFSSSKKHYKFAQWVITEFEKNPITQKQDFHVNTVRRDYQIELSDF